MKEETKIEKLTVQAAFGQFEQLFEKFCEGIEAQAQQEQLVPEQQLALAEQLKAGIEQRDKLGNCLQWLDGQAEFLREKEKQLAARRRNFEKFSAAVKSSLEQALVDMGVKSVEGNEYRFSIRKNPPRVEIVDEALVPPEFVSYTPAINRAAIKDALAEGKDVPGAALVRSTRLDVR
jgi:Uncharacterized protein involved in chromosome partitioning